MRSVFIQSGNEPSERELGEALANTSAFWHELAEFTHSSCPAATAQWKFSAKFGWSYRISDKKTSYCLFVAEEWIFSKSPWFFGQKAFDHIMLTTIDRQLKDALNEAKTIR